MGPLEHIYFRYGLRVGRLSGVLEAASLIVMRSPCRSAGSCHYLHVGGTKLPLMVLGAGVSAYRRLVYSVDSLCEQN